MADAIVVHIALPGGLQSGWAGEVMDGIDRVLSNYTDGRAEWSYQDEPATSPEVEMLLAALGVASLGDLKQIVDLHHGTVDPDPRWVPGWPEVTGS